MKVYKAVKQGALQPLEVAGVINDSLLSKEVEVSLKDKSSISGIVREVNGGYIVLSRTGDWTDKVKLFVDTIEDLKSSEHPYYTFEHKRNLRVQKIPRSEFRYEESGLKDLLGKFVFVNYDGKLIDGQIVDFKYKNKNDCSITIKSLSEHKTIESYRLRGLEITSENIKGHQLSKRLRQLEVDLLVKLDEKFFLGNSDSLKNKKIDPNDLIDSYFKARIDEFKDKQVDLSKFEYLWTQEIFDEYENCKSKKLDASLNEDLKKAREVNLYYDTRIRFVNFVIDEVKLINWTEYSIPQKDGIIEALEYLYDVELPFQ